MASSSSTSSSTATSLLTRYRPAILLLTGLGAAYGIYCLHTAYQSSSSTLSGADSSTQRLRRRNALHRPHRTSGSRRRPTIRQLTVYTIHQFDPPSPSPDDGPTSYGTLVIPTVSGDLANIPLAYPIISFEEFWDIAGRAMNEEEVRGRYNGLQAAFLTAFLRNCIPSDPEGAVGWAGEEGEALREELVRIRGFGEELVETALREVDHRIEQARRSAERQNAGEDTSRREAESSWDAESEFSWRGEEGAMVNGNGGDMSGREGQSLLNLLYHIAEDQARREGYVHRGVTCNACGTLPIRGIRYRCTNCIDFDLCETCEAMQVHPKTHLFYKVRIPAPFLGNPRQAQPVWYPGKPGALPSGVPASLNKRFVKETGFETPEVDALWDQFKCLANTEWLEDPNKLGMAIDRRTFDKCFVPNSTVRPPPPNLIYDRMFAFYDTNGDGLIGFEEFLQGLASLNDKSKDERMRRIFQGYDIDGDGYVNRKDFLRMFRAYYALSKELTRDMIAGLEEDVLESNGARDVVLGGLPISSAFSGAIPGGERSRAGEGKVRDVNGDLQIVEGLDDDGEVVVESRDDTGDRAIVVGDAAVRAARGGLASSTSNHHRSQRVGSEERDHWVSMLVPMDEGGDEAALDRALSRIVESQHVRIRVRGDTGGSGRANGDDEGEDSEEEDDDVDETGDWPPESVTYVDLQNVLGLPWSEVHEVKDLNDRRKVLEATRSRLLRELEQSEQKVRQEGIQERWRRRQFYVDEEEGAEPPEGYDESMDPDFSTMEIKNEGEDAADASGNPSPNLDDPSSSAEPSPTTQALRSPRSRSSSKVRFQDDLMDNDYETRSNHSTTSSRGGIVNERWGGYELPEAERDVGREILYQVTQQGLNELLDPLFKAKEDLAMEAFLTRQERARLRRSEQARELQGLPVPPPLRPQQQQQKSWKEGKRKAEGKGKERASSASSSPSLIQTQESTPELEQGEVIRDGGFRTRSPTDDVSDEDWWLRAQSRSNSSGPGTQSQATDVASASSSSSPDLALPSTSAAAADTDPSSSSTPPKHHAPATNAAVGAGAIDDDLTPRKQPPPHHQITQHNTSKQPTNPTRSPANTTTTTTTPAISAVKLERYKFLDTVEREISARGGPGRLNYEEFAAIMAGTRGRKLLGFVGGWVDMASF